MVDLAAELFKQGIDLRIVETVAAVGCFDVIDDFRIFDDRDRAGYAGCVTVIVDRNERLNS